jgi:hypothetical protein
VDGCEVLRVDAGEVFHGFLHCMRRPPIRDGGE